MALLGETVYKTIGILREDLLMYLVEALDRIIDLRLQPGLRCA